MTDVPRETFSVMPRAATDCGWDTASRKMICETVRQLFRVDRVKPVRNESTFGLKT
jgi:hypothetical protein